MASTVTPLAHDEEGWRSTDSSGALHFRMRHDGGAILCLVPRAVLLELPGVVPTSGEEHIFKAFERHLARFEAMANAKFAEGAVVDGEIVLDEVD